MRVLLLLAVVGLLVGCSKEPPRYESRYTPATTGPAQPQASFVDDFNRPDGPLGTGWQLLGSAQGQLPPPPTTDGFIRDGHFTYSGAGTVYAVRQFPGVVRSIGAEGHWVQTSQGGPSDPRTTIAMAITPNGNVISDMVHFIANRFIWSLTLRRNNGDFEPVAKGAFSPPLEFDRDYRFQVDVADDAVTVTVPGRTVTEQASTTGLLGDRAFWELRSPEGAAADVFGYESVWATVGGQPTFPLT